jgi:asparagine synthase (glutamine-hydrolysing)
MCGIAGVFHARQHADIGQLRRMAGTLTHRGPDDSGAYTNGNFGMAHTRLSIIGLESGHQPLYAKDKNLALIVNGEIYNYIELRQQLEQKGYTFSTRSDSEVILPAYIEWGDNFIRRLHGMFAFALYDKKNDKLLIARDRLGIKPLFLANLPDGIAFASEIKALLAVDGMRKEINPAGLLGFMQHQFSSGEQTIFNNVERVLPGEAILFSNGVIQKRWSYWSALKTRQRKIGFEEAQEEFDSLMEQVMLEHMRSDVPFGLFLSGGVDSSILLALLSQYKDESIQTFSIGFKDTRISDELPLASKTANRFCSRHTGIRPTKEEILNSLPYTVWAADELMRDYASLPTTLLAQRASQDLKVVFSGEGGDEVFAGYGRYRTHAPIRWLKSLANPGTGGFRTRGTVRGEWQKLLFGDVLLKNSATSREAFIFAWKNAAPSWNSLQRMQYTDLVTALPDNLLVKLDRMLMASSLEGRVPFLDHRIVEFGMSLPDNLKIRNGQGKYFLKQWASRFLPEEILFARKKGFGVPIGEWMQGEFLDRLSRVLPAHPAITAWFHPAGVMRLFENYKVTGPISQILWSLLQFAIWHDMFIEGNGSQPPVDQDPIDYINK